VVNKAASGGVAYRYKNFTARANANWQAPKIRSISSASMSFQAERTVIDIDTSYRFSNRLTVFVSGKNVTDAPCIIYDVNGVYGHKLETQVAAYGVSWTFGVKGTF
jgi:outer membrane receptor for ferric coprogen and ferric-rhodotorulic acid